MAVLVRRHLGQAENSVAALEAVVVRLLVGVRARIDATVLRRREFLEPGGQDRVGLLVLATVGHHLVRVRANKVAFEAMKMRGFVLYCAEAGGVEATGTSARDVGAVLLKIAPH